MDPLLILNFFRKTWMLWAAIALLSTGYLKGCSDEKERFDQFKAAVEAAGEAQEQWAKRIGEQRRDAAKAAEERYRTRTAQLAIRHKRELDKLLTDTSRGVVPNAIAAPSPVGQPGAVCFDRARLGGGIQSALDRLLTGAAGLLQRGDLRATALIECVAGWKEQEALGATK